MNVCQYCHKSFSSKYTVARHQKTSKYCLNIQQQNIDSHHCKNCNKSYIRLDALRRHERKCIQTRHKKRSNADDNVKMYKYMEENQQQMMQMVNLFKEFIQETKTTQSKRNLLDGIKPLTKEDLTKCLSSLSLDFIKRGAKGLADFAGNYPFKDRVIFTDRSRRKLQYKNEDGSISADGRALAIRFFNAILERNSTLIKNEYAKLHSQVEDIVVAGRAGEEDVSDILCQATNVQNILIKTENAAKGEDDDFIQEFLRHLSKTL